VVLVTLLLEETNYGWVYPIRCKGNKLLVLCSGGSTSPYYVQIKEYDISTSPPTLLRSSPILGGSSGWLEFDAVAFDEVNKKIICAGAEHKIIIMDYDDFSKYTVLDIPNGDRYLISIAIDRANNKIYISGSNPIGQGSSHVYISPYDQFLAGNPSWTVKDLNSILNLGYANPETQVRIFKGVLYALIIDCVNVIKTTLAKSTNFGDTWTIVRQSSSTSSTTRAHYPKIDANDYALAYSFIDTDDYWKTAITTDEVNFTVINEGYTDLSQTGGEWHVTVHTFGKYVVTVWNNRLDQGGGPATYQVRIYDLNGNKLYDSGQIGSSFPAHDGRQGLVDDYGRMIITGCIWNGSTANGKLVLIQADVMPRLSLSLSGSTLIATLTDQNGSPLSGKTLVLEEVKYINGANRLNTNPVTKTTGNDGKATFTVNQNTWYQVIYIPT